MNRQQAPGPPPGLFSSPGAGDSILPWAIPAAALLVAVAAGGVWLAGEVSHLAGGTPAPGRPLTYLREVISGRTPCPDAWGWVAVGVATAVLGSAVVVAWQVAAARCGRRHRADRGAGARAAESARLGGDGWAGSPLGRIIPGRQYDRSGPEDVSVDVWGARAGQTTKRVIPAILDAPGAVPATTN